MSRLGDEIHSLGLSEANEREAEIEIFKKAVAVAQKQTQKKGMKSGAIVLEDKQDNFYLNYKSRIIFT